MDVRSSHGGTEPWDGLTSATQALSAEDVASWSDAQVRDGLQALLAEVNRLSAVVSTVAASFDTRSLAELDGFRTTRSWLIGFGRMTQGAAVGWLSRGRLMAQLPALAAAAHAGVVSAEQLRPVAALVDHVGIGAVEPFDQILADLAAESRPADVDLACNRIRAHVDPDGPDPDPDAGARRGLTLSRSGALFSVAGRLDAEGGAIVLTALDALMRPPTPDNPRTAAQRRADAMVELARQALQGGTVPTVGGVRPQLGILLTPTPYSAPPPRTSSRWQPTQPVPAGRTVQRRRPPTSVVVRVRRCTGCGRDPLSRCPGTRRGADAAGAALEQLGPPASGLGGAAAGV
jgi:hypothetical protein